LALLAAGCGGNHSIVGPHGPEADRTAALSWFMFALAGAITLFVFTLLGIGLFRHGSGEEHPRWWRRLVIGGGVIMPAIVLATLSGLTVWALGTDPGSKPGDVHITVVGRQYFWDVHYDGTSAVTANEIHVPVDTPIRFTLKSADVIHSFWAPSLAGKVDMIPGHPNHLTIEVDTPGTYRGQCAELCGVQHANMAFEIIAQPEADYRRWLAHQAEEAQTPRTAAARKGLDVFTSNSCAGCHAIRGTSATATVGPDLTHLADRHTLAALTLPNDASHLRAWVFGAQQVKPGSKMPDLALPKAQADELIAYLRQLK
jgi:cytochrome c oxidase subunit 2